MPSCLLKLQPTVSVAQHQAWKQWEANSCVKMHQNPSSVKINTVLVFIDLNKRNEKRRLKTDHVVQVNSRTLSRLGGVSFTAGARTALLTL